jgi:Xaa-Pro dipeptidase
MFDYAARLTRLQTAMAQARVDLVFVNFAANFQYLTGIAREEPNYGNTIYPGDWLTGAWIPQQGAAILTVPRMLADFHLGALPGYDVRILADAADPAQMVADVLRTLAIKGDAAVAVEDRVWAQLVLNLQRLLPGAKVSQATPLLQTLRRIKDEDEIAVMRKAGAITEAAYAASLAHLRHGMTTLDLITEINWQLRHHGARTHSFVTSFYNMGPDFPFDFTNREELLQTPLQPPVSISYDFGAVYEGYCYDFGRAVHFGEPSAEYRKVYGLVMAAQAQGIQALAAGGHCAQADAAARQVIVDGGYGPAFRHRLGHGIGMDVHEPPFLSANDASLLEEGMCFTVEPSIFVPHQFGARVEDVVVVRRNGGEPLTTGFQPLYVVT